MLNADSGLVLRRHGKKIVACQSQSILGLETGKGLLLSPCSFGAMPPEASDGTYVRRVQAGERDAFRVLVERYQRMVLDLTNQYGSNTADAEDLAQEVFLRAFRKIDRVNHPDRFASWLYGLALNQCRDYAKNIRRDTYPFSATNHDDRHLQGESVRQDEALEADERSDQLWAALGELSPIYATPFLLKYRDGLTYQAMAERMDLSVSALKVRVHRARKKLRALLEEDLTKEQV